MQELGRGVYGQPQGKKEKERVNVTCVEMGLKGDEDHEGNFAANLLVTHSNASVRTIRTLFALARGVPIVSEKWGTTASSEVKSPSGIPSV